MFTESSSPLAPELGQPDLASGRCETAALQDCLQLAGADLTDRPVQRGEIFPPSWLLPGLGWAGHGWSLTILF